MTQHNPYLALVTSDVATEVQSSMQSAADKNPDTEAKLQSLAKAANVPIDTARLDQPAVQRQVDLSLDYKALAERYPSTAQLLTDPNNAALAKDDLPAISRLEDTLNFGKNMFRSVGAALTATSEGLYGVAQAGAETAASVIDPLVGTVLPQNPFDVMADKIRNWRTIAKSDTKVIEGDQAGMGFVQKSALSGAKSLGQSLLLAPAALMTGQPELLLYPMAAQTGGQAYGDARDKRIPVSGSLAFGASQMMIEYATERIPAITLLRDVGLQSSFKKMLVNQVIHEVPGEQVATVFQDLNEWAVLHPEKPFSDYLAERPSAAAQTLIATIVATGGQAGIGAAASRVANGSRQQQTVDMLTALKDGVVDSKTFERAPQRVRDFIAAHTKDGPLENVFIPAEQLTKYFQDTGINPAVAAAAMGATNYAEAHSAGTDVVIPLADFVANVAKTPHYDALLPDIRFAQGEMTARELDLYEKNHPDEVKRMVEEAKNFQLPVESPAITQITDDITGQLVADGMPRDTADSYATLYAKTIANLAGRSGMDPLALHQKYGLQVVRPMADVLTNLKNSDIQIDPLLDRLRSGDVPTDAVVNGPALMEFLRGIGGLKDTGGELRRMEVDTGIQPFVRNLIQQIDGKEVDEAAALAQEAGYPVQDILDAIAEEMQGKPIYSAHNANEQMLGLQRDLHNLGEYLQSIGVDLASATNDQVRQAMAAAIGNIYDQSANTPNQSASDFFKSMGIEAGATEKQVSQYHEEVSWKNYGTDEKTGFPVWSSDKVALQNPRDVTDTHDVFYKPLGNEHAVHYDILDASGKKVGYTVLELDGDMPARLLDIQIYKSEQGKQHAENTVAALAADAGELGIWHIIDSARSWWDRIGTRTLDQHDGTINFQDYADARASRENARSLGQSGPGKTLKQDKRGFIQFGPDRKFKIGLLEDVNLSTFLHETGHFWLEVMGDLASDPAAGEQVKADYAEILKFLKVESREQIGVEQHEMFARANEAYLREGKAPSPELRGMFQRFKAWLEMIYKAADELHVRLNDEVRGVFDRIYASDAEIEAAKHELDVSALLTTAADAGLSDAEFAAYQKSLEGEVARAKDELQARLMRQYQRERNKWWKDELAKVEADVTAEVDAQTDQNAFATLVQGALPDGTFIKLDKAELLEKYGKEYIKRLPRGKQAVYDSKGKGWALQDAAEILGFQTPDDLVQALVNLRPRKELIAAEAKARMIERHGDMLTDGTLHDEAIDALHNEERANRLAFELKAIRRKQREVKPFVNTALKQDKQQAQAATDVPPIQAFRDAARGLIGQKQVRELSPYSYLLAERKASKNAFAAMAKKDYQAAAIEKQRELLNHHLFLEATRAREEVDAIVSHMAKLGKPAARERIGKAGHDYLDQIDTLLEQYQFQNVSQRQIDRRKSLMEWYQEQVDNGFEPVIDAELLANARSLNYKELPVDQVRAINDAVRSIEHLASLKNKLLANKKGMEFDQAVDELVAIAEDNNGKINRPYDPEQRTAGEKTADWFAAKDRALVNVRTMVAWLDGGKVDGPWHTLLFNPSSDAQTAQLDMMKSVGKPVNDLMEQYMEGSGERMLDKFTTPLGVVSRKYLMSIAFNLGSESSFDKMLRGGPGGRVDGGGRVQWNEATIRGMVANLDAKDWKFIQGIWTILDTKMYPQINDLTKRVSGVPLEKVIAKPFTVTTRDGETIHLDGGYYPLKYDPKFSQAGLKQESGPLAGLTEVGYSSATTSRGHTKARIEGFAAPLLLDFTHILQGHLAGAIKDLTHREFLMDAQKILRNDRIRQVLQERIGTQYEGEFMSWLKRIANDGNSMPDMNFMDKFVEVARTNATIVSLGYKVSTIIAQAGGLFNAIEHPNVGAGWFYRGLSESTRHPVESYAMVVEKSGEMRHRFDTIDQTVREVLSKVQTTKYGKLQDGITRSAFIGINIADRMVTIPTWIAAYRKAVASGIAEEEAIHAADDAVVGSQGAGAAKDINTIQAARGAIKAFVMFYTPFAAQYNRMRSIGRAAGQQGWKYTPEAAMRVMMITFFPAVLMDLLTSRGPTHCDASDTACYAKWLAVKMVSSQTATLPFIRDIGNGLEQYVSGKQGNVKISPLIMAIDKVWNSVKHGFESGFGDRQFDQKQAFDIFESSGYLMGLPTGQARITSEYLADLMAGNNSPDSVGSFLHDLVFRREKK